MNTFAYLFTGFLEAGKTQFIQEVLSSQDFGEETNLLLLVCEEGMEEFDPSEFKTKNINCVVLEDKAELNRQNLAALRDKYKAGIVLVEYNGMWQIDDFFDCLPEDWSVYQEMFIGDASTILNYNNNMRSLVVDKLSSCDLVTFNRVADSEAIMPLHKLVRGVNRNVQIMYEMADGTIVPDEIEDPLPFDVNAEVMVIEDKDYAIFYRELAEDAEKYEGKTVKFKGLVFKDKTVPKGSFICGRHVMTCCVDDIAYSAVACKWNKSESLSTESWVMVTGKITVQKHQGYAKPGPVIQVTSVARTSMPQDPIAVFY